jgi:serine/threonine protein kinase
MRQDGTHGKPTRVFEQLVLVGYQTVEAVTRLNDSGLIHRDLKLDNVMVRLASPRLASPAALLPLSCLLLLP